jgi:hypothetical protein
MARGYSLREIREAGVYAWHPLSGRDLYQPHLVYRGISDDVLVATRDVAGGEQWGGVCAAADVPRDGWYHLDDCRCPLCRGASLALDPWQAEPEWSERERALPPEGREPAVAQGARAPEPAAARSSLLDALVEEADALQSV